MIDPATTTLEFANTAKAGFAPSCGCALRLTDRDLPPIARTEANLWKAKYFEAMRELTRANKGIRRLKAKCDRLQKAHNERAMPQEERRQ